MDTDKPFSVLLIHDEVEEANRLVSLLRNTHFNVEPHYADSAGELNKKVQERKWELILAQYHAQSVPAKSVLHQIRRLNKDIPIIFMLDEFNFNEAAEALKLGCADVIPADEDQYLIQVITRTLDNLDQRRKLRYWQRRFAESEDRFESLILSSQDGIAIIQEGTYVHVNGAFSAFFGYPDADSMSLLPVFDTIADSSQNNFKRYLKPLDQHNAWDTEVILFEGQRADESPIPVQATLSQIDFHGDQALQLLVKKDYIQSLGGDESATNSDSEIALEQDVSKIRLHDMMEAINNSIRRSAKNGQDSLLFYAQLDHFDEVQRQFGIGNTEEGMAQLARFLDGLVPEKVKFGRIREEAFIFILNANDQEKGLNLARRLLKEVSSQIFKTSSASFTCTLSIGITPIGEATISADNALTNCLQAINDITGPGKGGNDVKLHEPVIDLSVAISDADILRLGKQIVKKDLVDIAFQPLISLHGRPDEFYEVYMRIQPDAFADGDVPADFIARVFKTEIGRELDRIVIDRALLALAEKKKTAPNTRLCVHLSQSTIEDDKFISWFQSRVENSYLASSDLVFQMREIDISRHLGKAAAMLDRLRNFGAGTGLTHYGLAINPTTIFSRIKVDHVKIDGHLADKAQSDKSALSSLKDILKDLKGVKVEVTVPFIESAAIIPTLWQAGVDFLQGHYIQAPHPTMSFDFSQE
jgi:multidomain signaling protein FimX